MPALNQARATVDWQHPVPRTAPPVIGRLNLVPGFAQGDEQGCHHGIKIERSWREAPVLDAGNARRIVIHRFKDLGSGSRDYVAQADPGFAVLAIALRPTAARFTVGGGCVHDGPVAAGHAALTAAGSVATAQFQAPCDMLHLFVPTRRLSQIAREAGAARREVAQAWVAAADPVIERLAWLLLKTGPRELQASHLYKDGIALAIVSRLLECSMAAREEPARGLVKWRLRRVQNFVEDQLSERLALADLARAAGLSRMHFAAQFRAATGMRPHEYLVRRRIQKAQEILLTTSMPLVEVALSVGFQTQAHFTTVFRRFLGETPGRWREAQRLA